MEKQLSFNQTMESLCAIMDYILWLKGKNSLTAELNGKSDALTAGESNIINEIQIEIDNIISEIIDNLLKAKGILTYDDNCNYEEIQEEYLKLVEKGSKGYIELLKKYNLEIEDFETINIR